jgi:phosphopentomutase
VIARPFLGQPGSFYRTENRHDYAVPPPRENLLPALADEDLNVVCIGKIASIYDSMGVTKDLTAKNNEQSIDQTIKALKDSTRGLIFSNLVDFDMLYGHRRDTEGYAKALEHFDTRLPEIESAMRDDDLMMITADHGNDPTFRGSDHTREYAPLLVYGKNARAGVNLGTRDSLADIGQTIAHNFGLKLNSGASFLDKLATDNTDNTDNTD